MDIFVSRHHPLTAFWLILPWGWLCQGQVRDKGKERKNDEDRRSQAPASFDNHVGICIFLFFLRGSVPKVGQPTDANEISHADLTIFTAKTKNWHQIHTIKLDNSQPKIPPPTQHKYQSPSHPLSRALPPPTPATRAIPGRCLCLVVPSTSLSCFVAASSAVPPVRAPSITSSRPPPHSSGSI